jgi:transcriptional regulator with XRE-family HTH domain
MHREKSHLSMTALAAKAGLSQQMVSFVERGTRNPTLETLLRLSQALGVPLGKLITKAERKP